MQIAYMIRFRVAESAGYRRQAVSEARKQVTPYRYRLFEKLNITSDVELTLLGGAPRHGWTPSR